MSCDEFETESSYWTPLEVFTTYGCEVPQNTNTVIHNVNDVTYSWDPVPGASGRGKERWPVRSSAPGECPPRLPAPRLARGCDGSPLPETEGPRTWRPTPVREPVPDEVRRWASIHREPAGFRGRPKSRKEIPPFASPFRKGREAPDAVVPCPPDVPQDTE